MKGGITGNSTRRQQEHRLDPDYPDYNNTHQMLAHIWFDRIPLEADQELSHVLLDFVNAVINDKDASSRLKQLYTSLLSPAENEDGCEWHTGGPRPQAPNVTANV